MQKLHSLPRGSASRWWAVADIAHRHLLLHPEDWVAWNNGSNALWLLDDPVEAERWARRALELQPSHPLLWRSLGNALSDLGSFSKASCAYAASLRLLDSPETAFTDSKVLMAMGLYQQSFRQAERRQEADQWSPYRSGPFWQGWDEADTLVLWTEQGFGDVIQALRWLVPLQQRWPGQIQLEVEGCLVSLLRQGLSWMKTPPSVRPKRAEGEVVQKCRCHGSLLSLGSWLEVDLVPEAWTAGGYLRLAEAVRPKAGRRPRVGLVWASGRFLDGHVLERDYWRKSLHGGTLQALLQGLADRPIDLVNLQVGPDRQEASVASCCFEEELPVDADFLVSAQVMQSLDLIISVDTAAAHLAGALGLPVWILLPWAAESRWGRGVMTTPWYPTATLLRQPRHRDWLGLVRIVLARIDLWLCSW